jgi:hypothetical protein
MAIPLLAVAIVATTAVGVTFASSASHGVRACATRKGVLVTASKKDKCPKGDHKVTVGKQGARAFSPPAH